MNEKERDDYAAKQEQELREHDAHIAKTEAFARENEATEQLKELTGLKALQEKVRGHLKRFKEATPVDWDKKRSEVEASRNDFVGKFGAIKDKLNQIDQAREERLTAQLDQLDAEIVALDAELRQQVVELNIEEKDELKQVHERLAEAQEKRRQVQSARDESQREMKSGLGRAVDELKQTWQHARERIASGQRGEGSHP